MMEFSIFRSQNMQIHDLYLGLDMNLNTINIWDDDEQIFFVNETHTNSTNFIYNNYVYLSIANSHHRILVKSMK